MQLVSFIDQGQTRLGALVDGGERIVDLNRADAAIPSDILAFLAGGAEAHQRAVQAVADASPDATVERGSVRMLAPVPRPGKIMCIGLNYRDHAAESNVELPAYPTVFAKYGNTITAPGDDIVLPAISAEVDYEGELAVVIGQRCHTVSEAEALSVVAGYMAFNDVSARDYQLRTSQWTIGKTFDTFAPCGPALVTADEVPDPHALDIRVSIGGEVLQSSNTRHLIFNIPHLIAYISSVMTLEPGDIIATGTPAGVGFARTPPRFLQPGDVVRVEIQHLGALENPVVAHS